MPRTGAPRLAHDSGQGLVEYALILALASLAIMSVLLIFRNSIGNTMQGASNRLEASTSTGGYESVGSGGTGNLAPGGSVDDGGTVGRGGGTGGAGGYEKGGGKDWGHHGKGNHNGGSQGE